MDNAKFINTYIDLATGTIHEYLGSILQLKTNLKLAQEVVEVQGNRIQELEQQLQDTITNKDSYINELQGKVNDLTIKCNELENKASHIDTFAKTIAELKEQIRNRDETISDLQGKLPAPKPAINKIKDQPSKKPDDDF